MPRGLLITRGTIIEHRPHDSAWSIDLASTTPLIEVAALMQAFGCYAQLADGETHLLLLPIDHRPAPTSDRLAAFYRAGVFPIVSDLTLIAAPAA